ncbi:DUF3347 domain-containing protein [Chryseolinea lacunae]|uniref:DUF3347 domain-containing protein n=1 Tax=Chryseolinea lacunae TaxID=2801331 RepID=A0ABS1L0N0_9BACT|nr:DUF3347 domain-containing protein [Chryseolinea lacunae]MBL0745254.1 DUF3347 domain-containing protein [Chryseolinea lacunae]
MKTTLILLATLCLSLSSFAQAPTFADKNLGDAYQQYVKVKDALVASKSADVKTTAATLQKTLATVSNGKAAAAEALKVSSGATLDDQRKAFSTLSNEMATLVKAGKLSAGTLYVDYCPMANNNAGAFWLSNDKDIKNPYFGDKMLHCGMVKETLK